MFAARGPSRPSSQRPVQHLGAVPGVFHRRGRRRPGRLPVRTQGRPALFSRPDCASSSRSTWRRRRASSSTTGPGPSCWAGSYRSCGPSVRSWPGRPDGVRHLRAFQRGRRLHCGASASPCSALPGQRAVDRRQHRVALLMVVAVSLIPIDRHRGRHRRSMPRRRTPPADRPVTVPPSRSDRSAAGILTDGRPVHFECLPVPLGPEPSSVRAHTASRSGRAPTDTRSATTSTRETP